MSDSADPKDINVNTLNMKVFPERIFQKHCEVAEDVRNRQGRYLKLGANDLWAEKAFGTNTIPFALYDVPHELALLRLEIKIVEYLINLGRAPDLAAYFAKQICDFYNPDVEVWMTVADGLFWWAISEPEVVWLGRSDDYAPCIRNVSGMWRCASFSNRGRFFH